MENVELAARAGFDLDTPPDDYYDRHSEYLRWVRRHEPILRLSDGRVLLTRYQDVEKVWKDRETTVEKKDYFLQRLGDGPLMEYHTTTLLYRDPPDHTRLRSALNPYFTRASMASRRAAIAEIIERHVELLAQKQNVDFVSDFSFPVPLEVTCLALGFPTEDGQRIFELGSRMLTVTNMNVSANAIHHREAFQAKIDAAHEAASELKAYFLDLARELRRSTDFEPSASILCSLVAAEQQGKITETEVVHLTIIMALGGVSSTNHLLSESLHSLIERPERMEDLRANPDLIGTATQEFLRYVTPIQMHWRRTINDVTLPSGTIEAGVEVLLHAGSANRDETVFENPDELDLRRTPNRHIAFGAGVHFCIGNPLSRLEMEIAIPRILSRFRHIDPTGTASYKPMVKFRALGSLPLELR